VERESGLEAGAKKKNLSFPRTTTLRSGFLKSSAVNTFACDLDELKTK
jgi:hypothetical protein